MTKFGIVIYGQSINKQNVDMSSTNDQYLVIIIEIHPADFVLRRTLKKMCKIWNATRNGQHGMMKTYLHMYNVKPVRKHDKAVRFIRC